MKFTFNHFNFNVMDIEKSIEFYKEALGLEIARRYKPDHNQFELVYLKDETNTFTLELTQLFDRTTPYDLGESEFHLAFVTDDFDGAYARHKEMGCICFENPEMGIYFIEDLDQYWIEIVREK